MIHKMNSSRKKMTEKILNHALDIIYLLTGEEYTLVKKSSPHSSIHQLTGEVPIKWDDVAVFFTMEEWEYIEGHKENYKDVMVENSQSPRIPRILEEGSSEIPDTCSESPGSVQVNYKGENTQKMDVERKKSISNLCSDGSLSSSPYRQYNNPPRSKHFVIEDIQVTKSCQEADYADQNTPCNNSVRIIVEEVVPQEENLGEKDISIVGATTVGGTGRTEANFEKRFIKTTKATTVKNHDNDNYLYNSQLYETPNIRQREKPFACSYCGKCFIKKSQVMLHQKIHTGEKAFECSDCGKRFIQKVHLVIHQRKHTVENPFVCLDCGKCFRDKATLVRHKRIHTGEKPFECPDCGNHFRYKASLVKHQRIHTGEKPFVCSQCGHGFYDKANLVRHEKIHSGEKDFVCNYCGKQFRERTHLAQHNRTHTGEKAFACSECGKCFKEKAGLVRHQNVHTEEKPFTCSECGNCFKEKASLVRHQKLHA